MRVATDQHTVTAARERTRCIRKRGLSNACGYSTCRCHAMGCWAANALDVLCLDMCFHQSACRCTTFTVCASKEAQNASWLTPFPCPTTIAHTKLCCVLQCCAKGSTSRTCEGPKSSESRPCCVMRVYCCPAWAQAVIAGSAHDQGNCVLQLHTMIASKQS